MLLCTYIFFMMNAIVALTPLIGNSTMYLKFISDISYEIPKYKFKDVIIRFLIIIYLFPESHGIVENFQRQEMFEIFEKANWFPYQS